MIGQVVGSYHVVKKLGAGGMGELWIGEHVLLGRRVAIKFLLPDVSQDQGIVKRFFDEAKAATQIADPGIVVVYDFGWHDGRAYIVMEYLVGESAAERLQRSGRIPVAQALRLVQQVALSLSVAHGRGIIHRDIKPDNIFVVADPSIPGGERAKLLDFGIAKLIGEQGNASQTRADVVMGTPMYMSPEQCRGAGGVDHRTDIYALGCVLFKLVCGRLPFIQATVGDMIASHLLEPPPRPSSFVPEIPPIVDAIILRCLAKSPGERFSTMTELARAIAAVDGSMLHVQTIPPVMPVKRIENTTLPVVRAGESTTASMSRGRRVVITLAFAGGVAAAIVTATWLGRGDATPGVSGASAPPAADARVGSAWVEPRVVIDGGAPPDRALDAAADAPTPPDAAVRKQPTRSPTGVGSRDRSGGPAAASVDAGDPYDDR